MILKTIVLIVGRFFSKLGRGKPGLRLKGEIKGSNIVKTGVVSNGSDLFIFGNWGGQ